MKNVKSYSEMVAQQNIIAVNEGLLSNIKNLFASDYEIKNPILKELLREVDCPISWKETRLRNSVLKLVDEFVASQSKAYTEKLTKAKDDDAKEDAGEINFGSESHFGSLKSKRLAEKASATLSALKNLVASSKTAGDAASRWVQVVYDESVIATIQTALESADIDKTLKEKEMDSLEKAQEKLKEKNQETHDNNAKDFLTEFKTIKETSINGEYTAYYEKGDYSFKELTDIISDDKIDDIKKKGNKDLSINPGKSDAAVFVALGLAASANEATTKDIIDRIKKSEKGEEKLKMCYITADGVLTALASEKCDMNFVRKIKEFTSAKSFGDVSSLIDRLITTAGSVIVGQSDNLVKNYDALKNFKQNYEKYQKD